MQNMPPEGLKIGPPLSGNCPTCGDPFKVYLTEAESGVKCENVIVCEECGQLLKPDNSGGVKVITLFDSFQWPGVMMIEVHKNWVKIGRRIEKRRKAGKDDQELSA